MGVTISNELAAQLGLTAELEAAPGIILFDGRCRFCRRVVRSLLAGDPALRVCSVRSERGQAIARAFGRVPEDTFGFLTGRMAHFDVEAYITILRRNPGTRWLGQLIAFTPAFLSGAVYHWIERNRPLMSSLLPRSSNTTIDAHRFIAGGSED